MGVLSTTVTRELTLRVLEPTDGPRSVPVVLRYATADPWAVHATFLVGRGQEIAWLFGRELLAAGLTRRVGAGDVRIGPAPDDGAGFPAHPDWVHLQLRSPDGSACLAARPEDLAEFLRSTYDVCPRGGENDHVDWDGALASWSSTR